MKSQSDPLATGDRFRFDHEAGVYKVTGILEDGEVQCRVVERAPEKSWPWVLGATVVTIALGLVFIL